MTSVGSVADTIASGYDVRLAVVGLFTAALVLTHLLVQLPAGRATDRFGAVQVGLAAVGLCVLGNALGLLGPEVEVALPARAIVGLGSGAGFVAGADAMRATALSATWQGIYGASTMVGGGLAIAVTPQLVGELGWRAPYWSGLVIAVATGLVALAAPRVRRSRPLHRIGSWSTGGCPPGRDPRSEPWPQLRCRGVGGAAARAPGPRPAERSRRRRSRAAGGNRDAAARRGDRASRSRTRAGGARCRARRRSGRGRDPRLATAPARARARDAARRRLCRNSVRDPLRRGSATPAGCTRWGSGFVNAWAVLALLVCTPLAGLAFALPGDGRVAFAAIGVASAAALLILPRAPVGEADLSGELGARDG